MCLKVLIKVLTVGVNPCDVDIREGVLPGPPCPYVPGLDVAGYVELVGAKVTTLKVKVTTVKVKVTTVKVKVKRSRFKGQGHSLKVTKVKQID